MVDSTTNTFTAPFVILVQKDGQYISITVPQGYTYGTEGNLTASEQSALGGQRFKLDSDGKVTLLELNGT